MKLLLTHRFYAPDTAPYANMLRTIAEGLAAGSGHDVHVFASMPSYRGRQRAAKREVMNGVKVRRQWVFAEKGGIPGARVLNVLIYCAALFFHVLRLRPDVVSASTFPPVLAGWAASLAARIVGAGFVYHMQDVHPEVSVYSGGRLGRGWPMRLLRALDNQTLRRAAVIVVLSEDMADTVRARGLGDLPIRVVNNFQLDGFGDDATPPADLVKAQGKRRVIFAGNMGRFQNTDVLVEGVMQAVAARSDTELLLLGDGDGLPALKARWGDHPQVRFSPFLPFVEAAPLIADADVGLVSLTPDIYRVSFPSKVLTYAAMGLPMLAVVERESHLARLIEEARLGRVPEAATPDAIGCALGGLLDGPELRAGVLEWDHAHNTIPARIETWTQIVTEAGA